MREMAISLKKIANEIKDSGKDAEEALDSYYLNPNQKSRVRAYLGIEKRPKRTQEKRNEELEDDLKVAVERATIKPRKEIKKVIVKGKEYYDVTHLFIDCGG